MGYPADSIHRLWTHPTATSEVFGRRSVLIVSWLDLRFVYASVNSCKAAYFLSLALNSVHLRDVHALELGGRSFPKYGFSHCLQIPGRCLRKLSLDVSWKDVRCRYPFLQANTFLGFRHSSRNAGGTISDMFSAKMRGLATAIFAAAPFLGPALGPIGGGFLVSLQLHVSSHAGPP